METETHHPAKHDELTNADIAAVVYFVALVILTSGIYLFLG